MDKIDISDTAFCNGIIAEFLEWEFERQYTATNPTMNNKWLCPHNYTWMAAKYMKFNSSWDWIIPVCQILDTLYEYENAQKYANSIDGFYNEYSSYCEQLDDAVTKSYSIEDVYPVVIEFIMWFNSRIKNNK